MKMGRHTSGTKVAISNEVADSKNQESLKKKLQETQELFESLMNNTTHLAISVIDKNHKILRVNSIFAKLFNKSPESFIGKYCFQESEKRDHICPYCPGVKAMLSGKSEEVDTQGIRDDGSRFDAYIRAVPYLNSNNEVAGFIEMVEDVTYLRRAEALLKESEEKYRKQFEGAMDAIFIVDCETGILIDSNPAALKLVEREKSEIIGQNQRILYPPDVIDGDSSTIFEELVKNSLNEEDEKVLETKVVTKAGKIKHVAIKASVIEISGKKVLQGIFRDITKNKQKEKELQQTQEELLEASRRAGMAEVATDVLHNVGNVLNSVNVITTLIKETLSNSEVPNLKKVTDMIEGQLGALDKFFQDDPKGKHIPTYLKETVQLLTYEQEDVKSKLKTLVEDINHVKTIISMQQEYTKVFGVEVTIPIDQLIEDAIRMNEASLRRHKIRLVKECTNLGEAIIDKHRVIQILVNLINNAKYALAESTVFDKVLTIRSYKLDDNHLRIEVTDNGIGISKENLTKIFQHGFTTRKDGHGFGLHSGALAAKELNGSLTVQSEGLGHGATFILQLPFKAANECKIEENSIITL